MLKPRDEGMMSTTPGVLIRQGILPWPAAALLALDCAVLGDLGSYAPGRPAGRWGERHLRRPGPARHREGGAGTCRKAPDRN